MRQKRPSDVRGYRINCLRFTFCPLCYGCRAYDSASLKCIKCYEENKKRNICNIKLHTEKALTKMIRKEKIIIK